MSAEWSSWVEHATRRKNEGASATSIALELSQRGASAGEAEAVVRSIGLGFSMSADEQREAVQERVNARLAAALGTFLIVGGLVSLGLLGERNLLGGRAPFLVGAALVTGLTLLGKNVGIAFRR